MQSIQSGKKPLRKVAVIAKWEPSSSIIRNLSHKKKRKKKDCCKNIGTLSVTRSHVFQCALTKKLKTCRLPHCKQQPLYHLCNLYIFFEIEVVELACELFSTSNLCADCWSNKPVANSCLQMGPPVKTSQSDRRPAGEAIAKEFGN